MTRLLLRLLSGLPVWLCAAPTVAQPAEWTWPTTVYDLQQAWRYSRGAGVTVALVGASGVNAQIAELRGRVRCGYSSSGSACVDQGPYAGHDTGVASVIAAARDGTGTTGIAPEATIYATKGWDAAIDDAVRAGVDVIVMPVISYTDAQTVREAMARAVANDIVVITGVDNSREQITRPVYPADYPGVVGAGPVDARPWRPDTWGSVGPSIDFVALGDRVLIANYQGGYNEASGSSYSAGVHGGIAALIRSRHPDWSAAYVVEVMRQTARDLGASGHDWWFGSGLVDPVAALCYGGCPATLDNSPEAGLDTVPEREPKTNAATVR